MFAIEIRKETMSKILSSRDLDPSEITFLEELVNRDPRWIFVTGYTTRSGQFFDYVNLPGFVIRNLFEYDPSKISHDWDQIVRKDKK